jgi:hypothetical protein
VKLKPLLDMLDNYWFCLWKCGYMHRFLSYTIFRSLCANIYTSDILNALNLLPLHIVSTIHYKLSQIVNCEYLRFSLSTVHILYTGDNNIPVNHSKTISKKHPIYNVELKQKAVNIHYKIVSFSLIQICYLLC